MAAWFPDGHYGSTDYGGCRPEKPRVNHPGQWCLPGANHRALFPLGAAVEVRSDEDGFEGCFYEATVVGYQRRGLGYVVAYATLIRSRDGASPLLEAAAAADVRPLPPPRRRGRSRRTRWSRCSTTTAGGPPSSAPLRRRWGRRRRRRRGRLRRSGRGGCKRSASRRRGRCWSSRRRRCGRTACSGATAGFLLQRRKVEHRYSEMEAKLK
ncbi:unnamed protein product [Urochloa humidicola]